ncbi:MAG: SpaA isopeptide-forming pilin-related protein [Bulleidia sp.]
MPEIPEHVHDDNCYDPEGNLICCLSEVRAHEHTDQCYDAYGDLTCGQPETFFHQHTEQCFESHTEVNETRELICTKEEHQHSEECYQEETEEVQIDEQVQAVIDLIDALPAYEEADAILTDYDNAGNEEGYEAYYTALYEQVSSTDKAYKALSDEQKAQVSNSDKLQDYAWMMEVQTYAVNGLEINKGSTYSYTEYGLGPGYSTSQYWVTYQGKTSLAYCIEPLRAGPFTSDVDEIVQLEKNNKLASIYYYGSMINNVPLSGDQYYFDQDRYKKLCNELDYLKGDQYGSRFIIVHLALSYANKDDNDEYSAFYSTNDVAQALAKDLYDYAVNKMASQPIPDVTMSFSSGADNVVNHISLDSFFVEDYQRTENITLNADSRQSITLSLPDEVRVINSTDNSVIEGNTVYGGTTFYLKTVQEPGQLSYQASFTGNLIDYSAYKLFSSTDSNGYKKQNLFFLFGDQTSSDYAIDLNVTWKKLALSVKKVQTDDGSVIAGTEFIHNDPNGNIETLTTDESGDVKINRLSVGTHTITESTVMDGYVLNPQEITFTVNCDGNITFHTSENISYDHDANSLIIKNETNPVTLKIRKTNGDPSYPLEGAEFTIYSDAECTSKVDTQITDEDGILTFKNLCNRTNYWIKETKAPPGYSISVDSEGNPRVYSLYIEMNPNDETMKYLWNNSEVTVQNPVFSAPVIAVEISNDAIPYALPETGGSGTGFYTGMGIFMIIAAVILLLRERRRKEDIDTT